MCADLHETICFLTGQQAASSCFLTRQVVHRNCIMALAWVSTTARTLGASRLPEDDRDRPSPLPEVDSRPPDSCLTGLPRSFNCTSRVLAVTIMIGRPARRLMQESATEPTSAAEIEVPLMTAWEVMDWLPMTTRVASQAMA